VGTTGTNPAGAAGVRTVDVDDTGPPLRPARRDAIDVARIVALVIVVFGHLLLAVVDRPGKDVRGANLIALHPGWAWLAAVAPMPMFFAAGGWANATAALPDAAARLRGLIGLGAVVVTVWSAAVVVATAIAGDAGIVGDGARIATQPLWFLAAYVPFVACGDRLAGIADRRPVVAVGACLVALAVLDIARFAFDAPDWIGWPGFFLAWLVPWLLGAWWRARWVHRRIRERRVGLAITVVGSVACVALVALGGYAPALIDAVPDERSNTTPPTVYTAVAAVLQVGVLLLLAQALDIAGRRWRRLWDHAGEAAVGVYVWHLTALALCIAVVAAGFPAPARLTWAWWASRPLWWGAVIGVTAGLVGVTAVARRWLSHGSGRPGSVTMARAVAGALAATVGAAIVGLEGPRTAELALTCSCLFAASWWLLRSQSGTRARPQHRMRSNVKR
jgi:hypothetical protein